MTENEDKKSVITTIVVGVIIFLTLVITFTVMQSENTKRFETMEASNDDINEYMGQYDEYLQDYGQESLNTTCNSCAIEAENNALSYFVETIVTSINNDGYVTLNLGNNQQLTLVPGRLGVAE